MKSEDEKTAVNEHLTEQLVQAVKAAEALAAEVARAGHVVDIRLLSSLGIQPLPVPSDQELATAAESVKRSERQFLPPRPFVLPDPYERLDLEKRVEAAIATRPREERLELEQGWLECKDEFTIPQLQEMVESFPDLVENPEASGKRVRSRDRTVVDLEDVVRELREAGLTHSEMCDRLDAQRWERPPRASWKHLTWRKAFIQHNGAVKKWLSKACGVTVSRAEVTK